MLGSDFESFKSQEITFAVLNLVIFNLLLTIHTVFAGVWGEPSPPVFVALSIALAANVADLFWLLGRKTPVSARAITALTWGSILINFVAALFLAIFIDGSDSHYFVLMAVPVIEAAFRFPLPRVIFVVAMAGFLNFFWIWRATVPVGFTEYFEAGGITLIFLVASPLVCLLTAELRDTAVRLAGNNQELERTRERLVAEEKLAAVGRLSAAIAHEIRNPVAMISSSLDTAIRGGISGAERTEMFEIAAHEAGRLEKLTTDFLAYARPSRPRKATTSAADVLGYVAEICRARAGRAGVRIEVDAPPGLLVDVDVTLMQQALLNLVMNAADTTPPGKAVTLRAAALDGGAARFEVEDPGEPMPPEVAGRIFEPFVTTKPQGTGLGLAISRNIAAAHGGELSVLANQAGRVCFGITLPAARATQAAGA